jgi:lysophospholipase L1-like esterase
MNRTPERRRTHRLLAALAVGLLAVGSVSLPSSAQADPSDPGVDYVNLGDSYSAGSGNLPLARGVDYRCLQSRRNWAHLIAALKGYRLTDVSCGGAQTKDFTVSQYSGVAPQLDAVSADTDLVTFTIGGNDNGTLIKAATSCGAAAISTLGLSNPCEKKYGDSFVQTVQTSTHANLVAAFTALKAKAPNARIVAANYLWLLPPARGCFPVMPIARGDVPYLRNLQSALSDAIKQAAQETGVEFLDFSGVSEGRDACRRANVRWVEPVLVPKLAVIHPNLAGEAAMATHAIDALGLQ